jgi:hypothetical protein
MYLPVRLVLVASAIALLVGAGPAAPPSFKPLSFSILEDYDKGESLDEVGRDFALFRELGISTWRGSFGWDDYEPDEGRFDFGWLHQFVTAAARAGITLRPYVAYTPEWAAGGAQDRDGAPWNQPPRSLAAWSRFLTALAQELRHHPNVKSVEIYNEENVAQWWEGTAAEYARVLAAARPLKDRFSILAGGLTFADRDWVEAVCGDANAAAAMDVRPGHADPETWTPPGVTVENYLGRTFDREFAPAVDRACGPTKIWVNEAGFATTEGRSETQQAAWWVRAIATFAADPRVEHIGVYEIKDLRPDRPAIGDAPNYHLGLTRVDRSRKLAFATVQTVVSLLGQDGIATRDASTYVRRRGNAGEFHAHAFQRHDGAVTLIVWNRTAPDAVTLRLPSATEASEYRLDGSRQRLTPGRIDLREGIPRIVHLVPRPAANPAGSWRR